MTRSGSSLVAALCLSSTSAFYLPGIAPQSYCDKANANEQCLNDIPLLVNRLTSQDSVLPFEYTAFDFCQADSSKKSPAENLGQVCKKCPTLIETPHKKTSPPKTPQQHPKKTPKKNAPENTSKNRTQKASPETPQKFQVLAWARQ